MMTMILRWFLKGLAVTLTLLLIFLIFSIAPVDRKQASVHESYKRMMNKFEGLDGVKVPPATQAFNIGYSKINLTPDFPISMGGYGSRRGKLYNSIRDSIFVRAIVINNGAQRVALVSADLLLIPPAVTEKLESKLTTIGFSLNNTYLGATHTHNSIGNWAGGAISFFYGSYQDSVVDHISNKIVESIQLAATNGKPSTLKSGVIPITQAVKNRLVKGGPEDPLLRIIEINRNDSSKLLLMSFAAHATCLSSKNLSLSRDYPGKLVDMLESKGYSFVMFMAGAVGSQACSSPKRGQSCIEWMADEISQTFLANRNLLHEIQDTSLLMLRVPLLLSDPQLKIATDWKLRPWLFRMTIGESLVFLTGLRLGSVVMLGAPCDFSGEFSGQVDSFASTRDLTSMVTSFNGGYIGYITPINRYDVDHYETQLMNWYAPGSGEYIALSMEKLIEVLEN